ncbi:MAG: hypothetical protein CVV64_02180 [Candidatus Wallbacteria bacterium HGW-Wallbacteria-1]|jgi:HEAT repeat protein|uniref:Response regulatory domain-containing protein n=1 Tax=Candidatus Wallbacteria bacterium HGW-Wallbacteria-1 TaxID=2013854 RepID=A0A2N1PVB5_9BACT|nr:MAG: hypothetical protein CVV64_02180 [Candidatus Wallbacteria bacterium HGW-Wallbacteria-1]
MESTLPILVVSQDQNYLRVLAYNLGHAGFQVLTSGSVHDAVSIIDRQGSLSTVILDHYPGSQSVAFLDYLLARKDLASTAVMVLATSTPGPMDQISMFSRADEVLVKPVEMEIIIRKAFFYSGFHSALGILRPLLELEGAGRYRDFLVTAITRGETSSRIGAIARLRDLGDQRVIGDIAAILLDSSRECVLAAALAISQMDSTGSMVSRVLSALRNPRLTSGTYTALIDLLKTLLERMEDAATPDLRQCMLDIVTSDEFPPVLRVSALKNLIAGPDVESFDQLLLCFMDCDHAFVLPAISCLIENGSDEFLDGFLDHICRVFEFALPINPITGRLRYRNELEPFYEHLSNMSEEGRLTVTFSILKKYGARFFYLFTDALKESSPMCRASFINLIRRLGSKEALGWFLDLLSEERDRHVILACLDAIDHLGDARITTPVVEFLSREIQNPSNEIIIRCINCLRHSDERAVLPILGLMKWGVEEIWHAALSTLGEILHRYSVARGMIIAFVSDPFEFNTRIRETAFNPERSLSTDRDTLEAASALSLFKDPRIPVVMESALLSGNNILVKQLVNTLKNEARSGNFLKEVIPLVEVIESENEEKYRALIREAGQRRGEHDLLLRMRKEIFLLMARRGMREAFNVAVDAMVSSRGGFESESLMEIIGLSGEETGVNMLVPLLDHADQSLRLGAIRSLGRLGRTRGIDILASRLATSQDPEFSAILEVMSRNVSEAHGPLLASQLSRCVNETQLLLAIGGLARAKFISSAQAVLFYASRGSSESILRGCLDFMIACPHASFDSFLRGCLFHQNPEIRRAAIEGLAASGHNPWALAINMARSASPMTRRAALKAIVNGAEATGSLELLWRWIGFPDFFEKFTHSDASFFGERLYDLMTGDYERQIMKFLISGPEILRPYILSCLVKTRTERGFLMLAESFGKIPRHIASRVASELPVDNCQEIFEKMLSPQSTKDPRQLPRVIRMVELAGKSQQSGFLPMLLNLVKWGAPEIRPQVFSAIGRIPSAKSVNTMISSLSGMNRELFPVITEALINLGDENSISPLLHKVKGVNPDLKSCVIRVLKTFGEVNLKRASSMDELENRPSQNRIINQVVSTESDVIAEIRKSGVFDFRSSY